MPKINKFIIVAVLFLVIVLAVVFLVQRGGAKPPPTIPTPTPEQLQTFTYKDLLPGTSTQKDVMVKLGNPIRQEQAEGVTTLIYASGVGSLATRIELASGGAILLIREPVASSVLFSEQTASLGNEDVILWGDYSLKGYQLNVYLRRGVGFLVNPTTGDIKERWYFAPTTLQTFTTILAPGFQTSPPPPQE